jgi:flagellin-like protein
MPYSLLVYRLTGCEKMKKLFRSRKAVSPVIATVMMILVTMAGMTILFGFVISYSDSYKAGIGSSIKESLTIEDVWFRGGGSNNVELSIYNVGKLPVNVKAIYVNGLNLNVRSFNGLTITNNLNINGEIPINSHVKVIATCNWQSFGSSPIVFKIATERGSTFEQSFK